MIARIRLAAACGAAVLAALALTTAGPLGASAATAEVDSAVLTYTPAGWTCSLDSTAEGTGTCTVQSIFLGATCLGIDQLVRPGSISLVEPAGDTVLLSAIVAGTTGGGGFEATGTDGTAGINAAGTYSTSCQGDRTTSIRVTLSWGPPGVSISPTS